MNSLVRYDAARKALAEARRVDEVKSIRDKAVAMQAYAKQANDYQLLEDATEIRARAEHKAGTMLREMKERGELAEKGERKDKCNGKLHLDDIGVERMESSRWQKAAALPEDEYAEKSKNRVRAIWDKDHVRSNLGDGDYEWYTPAQYVELARKVLGEIDLDPATSVKAQKIIQAKNYFTKKDNGLLHPWKGHVWLNPPYERPLINQFVDKLVEEIAAGNVTAAILLTNNYTDTSWFHKAAKVADAICFTLRRIKFIDESGQECDAPIQGQAFFYFGDDVESFAKTFVDVGFIVVPK